MLIGDNIPGFCAIIRGPMAAREMISGIASNPKTDTMACKHQLRNITPGAIAATAVLVRSQPSYVPLILKINFRDL